MADTDGTGSLAYQEFARKFAAYKVRRSSSEESGFLSLVKFIGDITALKSREWNVTGMIISARW